ncbi:MAG: hypothetical protein HY683_03825 [Chloroflexi bacterium]|nr:hypothetical protein [Chloroflexota bacterium]
MTETGRTLPRDIEALLDTFRSWLCSETSISQPSVMKFGRGKEQEAVVLTVQVRNSAPPSNDGAEIVFVGVGLRISDAREPYNSGPRWVSDIKTSRPSDQQARRKKYDQGTWVSGRPFPAETSDEKSFGEVLFPRETVVYELRIPTADLPYASVQVEGSVSRRHLWHFVETPDGIEQYSRPLLLETLRVLNTVEFQHPVAEIISSIPDFGPNTTLEQLEGFRKVIEQAMSQISTMRETLNKVFHTAPNRELREHIKEDVGRYLLSVEQACTRALEAVSSGNMGRIRDAATTLKQQLAASEEVPGKTLQLLSRLRIAPDEVGFGAGSS